MDGEMYVGMVPSMPFPERCSVFKCAIESKQEGMLPSMLLFARKPSNTELSAVFVQISVLQFSVKPSKASAVILDAWQMSLETDPLKQLLYAANVRRFGELTKMQLGNDPVN